MKYTPSLLALAAITMLCASCAPVSSIQSSHQKAGYNINQVSDLIGDTSLQVHGEQNVLYSISNDNANLYITLMVADPRTQNKFLRNGFTLWIDTTGNKKESLGIAYPLPSREHRKGGSESKNDRQEQEQVTVYQDKSYKVDLKRQKILTMIEMDLIGYQGKNAVRVTTASITEGINVSILVDSNGALQYHAIIPFSAMHYHPGLHIGTKAKPLTIALTTNKEETKPAGEKGSHGGGGMGGDPMGGGGMSGPMGGGGGRGHGGGGEGGQMDPANDPVDIWMHVKLAGN